MKKTLIEFLKEIVPVIIGILIALYINNWNEERKDNKYTAQIMESIKLELSKTKTDIAKNMVKQENLIDSLYHAQNKNEASLLETLLNANGVSAPYIRMNSWNAISSTKIELIDYKQLATLSNIEEEKDLLKEKLSFLMNFLYMNLYDTSKEKKETVIFLLKDIMSTETAIKDEIESLEI